MYYIRHNYMFQPLMLAIYRLCMDLSSSYTTDTIYVECFLGVSKGFVWGTEISFVSVVGACTHHWHIYTYHIVFGKLSAYSYVANP